MPYYTRSYNPYSGVSNPLYTIPRVEEVNQKDAEIAFNEQEMETYARALGALGLLSDRNKEAQQRQAAMVGRNVRLNQDPNYQPGVGINQPITNVQEVGPMGFQPPKPLPPLSTIEVGSAAYQPGYQGGMDFADLQGMVPPPPTNKASSIVDASLDTGQQIARDQNRASTQGFFSDAREGVSSLLGGLGEALSSPFAQRILAIMARPEFQDPRGISAGIVGAAAGLKEDEKAAAKVRREEQKLANEARRQAFLDEIKLAELGLSKRRTELSEKTEERVAGKPVTVKTPTKNEYKELESRLEIIPGVKDYISKSSRSWMYGSGENPDVVRRRLIYAANEEAQRKGISFEDAVATLTGLGGSPRSTTTAPQSARPGVKERG